MRRTAQAALRGITRRAILAGVLALAATPAVALMPCPPGTRDTVLALMRFSLLLPDGDEVTEAQWQTFRSDIMDAVLRTNLTQADEPPQPGPPPQRARVVHFEIPVRFNPDAPPQLPPSVGIVTRAWTARFPAAPVEARIVPVCLRLAR